VYHFVLFIYFSNKLEGIAPAAKSPLGSLTV